MKSLGMEPSGRVRSSSQPAHASRRHFARPGLSTLPLVGEALSAAPPLGLLLLPPPMEPNSPRRIFATVDRAEELLEGSGSRCTGVPVLLAGWRLSTSGETKLPRLLPLPTWSSPSPASIDADVKPPEEPALARDLAQSLVGSGRCAEPTVPSGSVRKVPLTGGLPSASRDSTPCPADNGDDGGDRGRPFRDREPAAEEDMVSLGRPAASSSGAKADVAWSVAAVETGEKTGRAAVGGAVTALRLGGRTTTPLRARLSARETCR